MVRSASWAGQVARLGAGIALALGILTFLPSAALSALALPTGQIAFESDRQGNWDIYLADVQRQTVFNLTRSPMNERAPSWSSDGSQIAFYAERDASGRTDLYVMNASGGNRRVLLSNLDENWLPAWSPLGDEIAYMTGWRIALMSVPQGRTRPLAEGFSPSWSPDGQWVAFYSSERELNSEIYVMRPDGSDRRNLTRHPANDWAPAWSPDGRYIAFVSGRDGNAEIYRMRTDCLRGAGEVAGCHDTAQRLTYNHVNDLTPTWSADGAYILFVAERGGFSAIYRVDADGEKTELLISGPANNQHPAWRPR